MARLINLQGGCIMKKFLSVAVPIAMAALTFSSAQADTGGHVYNVRITNVTRGQVVTPPVLVSHKVGFELFSLGAPASPELTKLAEDGMADDLVEKLAHTQAVYDVATAAAPLLPGQSVSLQVSVKRGFPQLSAVGMLASTNDAFFAMRGVNVPLIGKAEVEAGAYDAGTEANNESCVFIPGPPCGSGEVRDTTEAEGYVHVHAGIHGIADLDPAVHDWRNPVVEISISKMR
jgi:Spondin_N